MSRYIQIDKADVILFFAVVAACFAYDAWKEASSANYHARRNLDPITVEPASDGEADSEDADE